MSVNTPAAGAVWKWQAPTGYLLKLKSVSTKLVTNATVGNRIVVLQVLDSQGLVLWNIYIGVAITASKTAHLTWMQQGPATHANATVPDQILPNVTLPPGCSVTLTVNGLNAADKFTTTVLIVELI